MAASTVHVGRQAPRGEAMMVLTVDEPVPQHLIAQIEAQTNIRRAYSVLL